MTAISTIYFERHDREYDLPALKRFISEEYPFLLKIPIGWGPTPRYLSMASEDIRFQKTANFTRSPSGQIQDYDSTIISPAFPFAWLFQSSMIPKKLCVCLVVSLGRGLQAARQRELSIKGQFAHSREPCGISFSSHANEKVTANPARKGRLRKWQTIESALDSCANMVL
jgi:hypothetical protein